MWFNTNTHTQTHTRTHSDTHTHKHIVITIIIKREKKLVVLLVIVVVLVSYVERFYTTCSHWNPGGKPLSGFMESLGYGWSQISIMPPVLGASMQLGFQLKTVGLMRFLSSMAVAPGLVFIH